MLSLLIYASQLKRWSVPVTAIFCWKINYLYDLFLHDVLGYIAFTHTVFKMFSTTRLQKSALRCHHFRNYLCFGNYYDFKHLSWYFLLYYCLLYFGGWAFTSWCLSVFLCLCLSVCCATRLSSKKFNHLTLGNTKYILCFIECMLRLALYGSVSSGRELILRYAL